jgi:hypothetical protein
MLEYILIITLLNPHAQTESPSMHSIGGFNSKEQCQKFFTEWKQGLNAAEFPEYLKANGQCLGKRLINRKFG